MASGNGVDGNGIPGSKPNPDLKIYVSSDMDTVHRNDEFKVTLNFTNIGKSEDNPITKIKMVSEIPNGLVNTTNLYLDDRKRFRDGFFDDKNYIRIETETNLKKGESLLIYYNATINKSNRRKYPEHIPLIKIDNWDVTFFFKDECEAHPDESMITVDSIKLENAKPKIEMFNVFHNQSEVHPNQSNEFNYTLFRDAEINFSFMINDSDDDNFDYKINNTCLNRTELSNSSVPNIVNRETLILRTGIYKFKIIVNDTHAEDTFVNETTYKVIENNISEFAEKLDEERYRIINESNMKKRQQYRDIAIISIITYWLIYFLLVFIYWLNHFNENTNIARIINAKFKCELNYSIKLGFIILALISLICIIAFILLNYKSNSSVYNIHLSQIPLLTFVTIMSLYLFCLSNRFRMKECICWLCANIIIFSVLYFFLPELIILCSYTSMSHTYSFIPLSLFFVVIGLGVIVGLAKIFIIYNKYIKFFIIIYTISNFFYIYISYRLNIPFEIPFSTKLQILMILLSESITLFTVTLIFMSIPIFADDIHQRYKRDTR